MRVAFYAVNGLGLGHVTRLLAMARAVRRRERDAEVLFVTSSEADAVIYREGFAAVKVPSKTIREQCGLGKAAYLRTVQQVTWSALSGFDPDVLVVDTYPTGSFDELLPVLRWRQRNVFVFREQREEAATSEHLQAALRLYDRVLVPHETLASSPVPEPEKAVAIGPVLIRDRDELVDRAEARRALQLPASGALVYASFGGGGDPEAARALQLTADLLEKSDAKLVIGAGPLMRDLPSFPGAPLFRQMYPALDYLAAFDAAVAAAGYNTAHELLYAGVPTVLVPFGRVLDDQEKRVRTFVEAGAAVGCTPLTRQNLEAALREVRSDPTAAKLRKAGPKLVPRNGADAAARAILELA